VTGPNLSAESYALCRDHFTNHRLLTNAEFTREWSIDQRSFYSVGSQQGLRPAQLASQTRNQYNHSQPVSAVAVETGGVLSGNAYARRERKMRSMAKIRLTPEGLARLQHEQDNLMHVRRQEVAERIRQAREESHGDSGDSTAYEDAKTELALLEQRIAELERTLAEVELVTDADQVHTEITIGCHVTIRDSDGEQEEYVIVDHADADPRQGRLSQTSPVGSALLGHKAGDEVEAQTPAGTRTLTIVEIH
jgi:transcription elongation factor GreA